MVSGSQSGAFTTFHIFLDCLLCCSTYLVAVPVLSVLSFPQT